MEHTTYTVQITRSYGADEDVHFDSYVEAAAFAAAIESSDDDTSNATIVENYYTDSAAAEREARRII